MYVIYSGLLALALLLGSPWFLYQGLRRRKYFGSLRQRLGALPVSFNLDAEPSIWVHAVSVGEVLAARPLVDDLRARYPGFRLFVSTTTVAGQQLARRQLPQADAVFYFPIDFAWVVRRVLDRVKPRLLVLLEGEIWPHVLRECRRRGVRTAIVNGRVSARSFPRYRLLAPLMRHVLADVDAFCMQSDEGARRINADGRRPGAGDRDRQPEVRRRPRAGPFRPGPPARTGPALLPRSPPAVRWWSPAAPCAARNGPCCRPSGASRPRSRRPCLILAPRHTDRFTEVMHVARGEGFATARRTELAIDAEPRADVVVLDTIGELAQVYQLATVAFVGGSLVPTGGHNILEPAVYGRPVVFGPSMTNFAEIAEMFLANGAAVQVHSEHELEETLISLMSDSVRRAGIGAAARALVDANRGATERTLDVLIRLLPRPAVVRPFRRVH